MPARVLAICTAAAVFFRLRPRPNLVDMDDRIIKAIDDSHQSWVEKGWVEEKASTRV
jgi:hypothetical protein